METRKSAFSLSVVKTELFFAWCAIGQHLGEGDIVKMPL